MGRGMNLNTRGDGWLVLLIAVVTLCIIIGMGAWAESRPCEEVGENRLVCLRSRL